MKNKAEDVWEIGNGNGYFLDSNGGVLMVARVSKLPSLQRHHVVHNSVKFMLDLVGVDASTDIALLRPVNHTFALNRMVRVAKAKRVAEALELNLTDLSQAVENLRRVETKIERTYRDYTPEVFAMHTDDFAALQQTASHPFGVFSRDQFGNVCENWSTGVQKRLDVPAVWKRLALTLPATHNFFLRGFEVVTYRQKYNQGFTVPRIIEL